MTSGAIYAGVPQQSPAKASVYFIATPKSDK
jgi:hypothetical protein